jgi:hypothetical protein
VKGGISGSPPFDGCAAYGASAGGLWCAAGAGGACVESEVGFDPKAGIDREACADPEPGVDAEPGVDLEAGGESAPALTDNTGDPAPDVSTTSDRGSGGAVGRGASSTTAAKPSNTREQTPQRTNPLRTRNWSATTLKAVPQ